MQIFRIEVEPIIRDPLADNWTSRINSQIPHAKIRELKLIDVYTITSTIREDFLDKLASDLTNPITHRYQLRKSGQKKETLYPAFNWAVEIGFLPGLTDNIANTAKLILEDLINRKLTSGEGIYTSKLMILKGVLDNSKAEKIAALFANPLINRIHLKSYYEFSRDSGMDFIYPRVQLRNNNKLTRVNLDISDENLSKLAKFGIEDQNGARRGPLALHLEYLKAIRDYFKVKGRLPTDIELESLAQTWSEHCKHTIFRDPIDNLEDGLFNTYIRKSTEEICKSRKGECLSVFKDNSGAVSLNSKYAITYKVETHNSPSALDPFGGAITGIVGVNRDTIGFGLGAKPICNFYGYCLADPKDKSDIYRDWNCQNRMLTARRMLEGVVEGVNKGGNQSGIPTTGGFIFFDKCYRGKPLVFVGTLGLIPKKSEGKSLLHKQAKNGDLIVMVGGKVGKDGIHGATFSSQELHAQSPASAVQIGDPITQKKLSDALVDEIRDLHLYNSITDNGAGGLSCSVAEMAKESGGCLVDLDKVPLKYDGLAPWEIWISESQERMTLAVPPKNWPKLQKKLLSRGVESWVIGKFTAKKKCQIYFYQKKIMDVDMDFLHEGLPKIRMTSKYYHSRHQNKSIPPIGSLEKILLGMLKRPNLASFSFISNQYDHTVGGRLVISPLQGRGRVNGDATVIRPLLDSNEGVILSHGIFPKYSRFSPYHMAAACIDTAIRNAVSVGADPEKIYLLDNFCWPGGRDPFRLAQLKEAARACYDYSCAYQTPFISGKDSMYNDFNGFNAKGNRLDISILPTLLISAVGITDNLENLVSLDAKFPSDLVYVLGNTQDELAGSEYYSMLEERDNKEYGDNDLPHINPQNNLKLYKTYFRAVRKEIISSAISIGRGGLGIALVKMSIGGFMGAQIELRRLRDCTKHEDSLLFSESQGRILVTIKQQNKRKFEKIFQDIAYSQIGILAEKPCLIIKDFSGSDFLNLSVKKLHSNYHSTFAQF